MQPVFWFFQKACCDRVVMYIVKLLTEHFDVHQLNRMVVLLPELPLAIIAVLLSSSLHHPNHPFSSAFDRILLNRLFQSQRGITFHVPDNVLKLIVRAANNHMHMAWHNNPTIYFKAFIFLAILPALNDCLEVSAPDKPIYPIYNRVAYEI